MTTSLFPLRLLRDSSAFWPVLNTFDTISRDLPRSSLLWSIDTDETDTQYTFSLPLPGYKKHEVSVSVEDEGYLTIEAARGGGKVEGNERKEGALVSRAFTLPTDSDASKIEAKLEDGVLTLVVPKVTKAAPRKVVVS